MALYIHYSEVAMAALSRQVWKLGDPCVVAIISHSTAMSNSHGRSVL